MAKGPKRPGGNPPEEHQFKPGQSGNPGGRPKKHPTAQDLIVQRLMRRVSVIVDGKRQEMTVLEALTDKNLSAAGPRDFIRLIRFAFGEAPSSAANDDTDDQIDGDDAHILAAAVEREIARRTAGENRDG